jgi:hypothetical protein
LLASSAPAFTVEGGALVEVALDGEPAVLDPPLEFTSLPAALRLRCRPTDVLRICEDHSPSAIDRGPCPFPAAERAS